MREPVFNETVQLGIVVRDLGAVAAAGAGGLGVTRRRPGARGGDGVGAVQGGRCVVRLAILPRHPRL